MIIFLLRISLYFFCCFSFNHPQSLHSSIISSVSPLLINLLSFFFSLLACKWAISVPYSCCLSYSWRSPTMLLYLYLHFSRRIHWNAGGWDWSMILWLCQRKIQASKMKKTFKTSKSSGGIKNQSIFLLHTQFVYSEPCHLPMSMSWNGKKWKFRLEKTWSGEAKMSRNDTMHKRGRGGGGGGDNAATSSN